MLELRTVETHEVLLKGDVLRAQDFCAAAVRELCD